MKTSFRIPPALACLSLSLVAVASCGSAPIDGSGDGANAQASAGSEAGPAETDGFQREEMAQFDEPWALAFEPGTGRLFVTEKAGQIRFLTPDGEIGTVSGVPEVDYGGQGGLGDFVFGPDYADDRMVYLSWAEAGPDETRGAAVGRARLTCGAEDRCALEGLEVIWRQQPKVTGRGHYSHRIAFSPDGSHLFIASGDRQKMEPAQDLSNNLGAIVRLLPDGTPAPGNPFADRGGVAAEIWSYGHRNMLGIGFDGKGRLWALEHGPRGGDELNLVRKGANYGWPLVSDGVHYNGDPIPDHHTRPDLAAPAIEWTPVIAPGNFIFYSGEMFRGWQGDLVTPGLKTKAIIRVAIDGESAREIARYPMPRRMRAVAQGPDGAIWAVEDESDARLWRLTPHSNGE